MCDCLAERFLYVETPGSCVFEGQHQVVNCFFGCCYCPFAMCNPEAFAPFQPSRRFSVTQTNITMAIQITRAIKLLSLFCFCYGRNDTVYASRIHSEINFVGAIV